MTAKVITRFAPSPTGYLHIGGARTALFCWAYARRHDGAFILRIEDTDVERSTEAAVDKIYESMRWLELEWDVVPPPRQMQRLPRYQEAAAQLLKEGKAYHCYASKEELEALREQQRARGEKPRYDGRWRPENARGKTPPADVQPVVRFRNPNEGIVAWRDLVKGPIEFANAELDDLVILRGDGVPTYNFGVVVDDIDMHITHCIRGDDHVNNTPRQINIYHALGATPPLFAHVPMILGTDGERLSKRHGAVGVLEYRDRGYLPEAVLNYFARLGWSHGDAEIFSREQFLSWFDLEHVSHAAARFDPEKLAWLNQEYMKIAMDDRLAAEVLPRLERLGGKLDEGPPLEAVVGLFKARCDTLETLAAEAMLFYGDAEPAPELLVEHVTDASRPVLRELGAKFEALPEWTAAPLGAAIKEVLALHKIKMPALAIPLRVAVFGRTQTPDLSAVLALLGRERTLARLSRHTGLT
ncbi:MAG: glutamate--tRNA ligase [Burkholderiales bacterium]